MTGIERSAYQQSTLLFNDKDKASCQDRWVVKEGEGLIIETDVNQLSCSWYQYNYLS
jgi:hypothetical protein